MAVVIHTCPLLQVCVCVFFLTSASLSCSSDMMTVILSKSYLDALGYDENDLVLNDPTCKPISLNPVTFTFPLNSCGTLKKTVKIRTFLLSA